MVRDTRVGSKHSEYEMVSVTEVSANHHRDSVDYVSDTEELDGKSRGHLRSGCCWMRCCGADISLWGFIFWLIMTIVMLGLVLKQVSYLYLPPLPVFVCHKTGNNTGLELVRYQRDEDFSGKRFLDNWDFWTDDDPTHGTVNYVDRKHAADNNLTYFDKVSNLWHIRADQSKIVSQEARGRDSVRLESKKTFHHGLFVLDTTHIPTGCGTWPAWWMYNDPWPYAGEIDIVEQVHNADYNKVALHTNSGCSMGTMNESTFQGVWTRGPHANPATNCDVNATDQFKNQGCQQASPTGTFGNPWNAQGGGVHALLWDEYGIKSYVFKRDCIPDDLRDGRPTPSTWPLPVSQFDFGPDCDGETHFKKLKIVINIALCGDWAGESILWDANCLYHGRSCDTFVRNSPEHMAEAYWGINYIHVYKKDDNNQHHENI